MVFLSQLASCLQLKAEGGKCTSLFNSPRGPGFCRFPRGLLVDPAQTSASSGSSARSFCMEGQLMEGGILQLLPFQATEQAKTCPPVAVSAVIFNKHAPSCFQTDLCFSTALRFRDARPEGSENVPRRALICSPGDSFYGGPRAGLTVPDRALVCLFFHVFYPALLPRSSGQ